MPVPVGRAITPARRLAAALEPVVGQVYFSPECHAAYVALGFGPSPGKAGQVALPDGAAYFTSRGSVMGQVPGELVAAAFAVFNPAVVVPAVTYGWTLTDARDHLRCPRRGRDRSAPPHPGRRPARLGPGRRAAHQGRRRPLGRGATAVRGHPLPGAPRRPDRTGLAARRPAARVPGRLPHHRAGCRPASTRSRSGCSPSCSGGCRSGRTSAPAPGAPSSSTGALERLRSRGLLDGDAFSDDGRDLREHVESVTDAQLTPVVAALGGDLDEVVEILAAWGKSIRDQGGYLGSGAGDLALAR